MDTSQGFRHFTKQVTGALVILGIALSFSGAAFAPSPWPQDGFGSGQSDGQEDGAHQGRNPIAGGWHAFVPNPNGGTNHLFYDFEPSGRYMSSAIILGGPQNGMRSEMWGSYSTTPADGGVVVTITLSGYAPQTLCMAGQGCRTMNQPRQVTRDLYRIEGNRWSEGGVIAERAAIPPVLMQQLAATWRLQPPPPLPQSLVGNSGGGRYISPKNNIPGLGNNCDDLQQSRICTYGHGVYHKDSSTGCMVCTQ